MLLILDNVEQVLEGAPLITGVLEAAPRLTVLATGREIVHLTREQVVPVPATDRPVR